jgi:6-pyruvoyltetrahydropterin/6-carboxytetrahydropterin synthase
MLVQLGTGQQIMKVSRDFAFEAMHWLPNVPSGHKCGRPHGHSYKVRLTVRGPVQEHSGWVIDYADIKKAFADYCELLDHSCINEINDLQNSTTENLALWIAERMKPLLPGLCSVIVKETEGTRVELEV